jgi:hypothetical protein
MDTASLTFRSAAKRSRLAACAFVAAAALLGTTPAPNPPPSAEPASAPAPLTPEAIYVRAVHAMKAAPQPPYVTFRETVSGRNFRLQCTSDGMSLNLHHGDAAGSYDVWFRTSDGSAISRDVARATASPCPGALLVPAGSVIPTLGAAQPSPAPTTDADPGSAAGPPIIAAVHVDGSRYYHIELVGHENLDGNDVYHLKLTAYRDPTEHPLTDLYVDPQTFLVREARGEVSLHMVIASGRFAGVVDFDRFGDYWLLKHEAFDAAANALLMHAHMTAVVDATNFTTPEDLPGIPFPTPQPKATPATPASPPAKS